MTVAVRESHKLSQVGSIPTPATNNKTKYMSSKHLWMMFHLVSGEKQFDSARGLTYGGSDPIGAGPCLENK